VLDPFTLPFFQRAVLEVLVLALGAGLLGTWIVLRGQAFYAHAVGTATFPGLVLADGLGFSASLGAFGTALLVAVAVTWLGRRGGASDSLTALVLCGALAAGVILASDVFGSPAGVDTLLFGSLLAIDAGDVVLAAAVAAVVLLATVVLGPRWLAAGFDATTARAQGLRSPVPDALLLGLIALAAVAVLSAVGALLATALLVVPAATTRLLTGRMGSWQVATVALAAAEGVAGLWLSFQTDAPPGATIAVLGGGLFALAALGRAVRLPARAGARAA
jgi:ABC-type Mn2+/Zn2+ transport system permease subunit